MGVSFVPDAMVFDMRVKPHYDCVPLSSCFSRSGYGWPTAGIEEPKTIVCAPLSYDSVHCPGGSQNGALRPLRFSVGKFTLAPQRCAAAAAAEIYPG